MSVAIPEYWSSRPRELEEALNLACGATVTQTLGRPIAPGATAPSQERLTLTVEEAAAALGISRAFAYESVRRGDIPHIKIGRRVLVPRAALDRLLASAMPDDNASTEH
jgi:excisionase family DNA binding protein